MKETLTISQELEDAAERSAKVLLDFDRLPNNPDRNLIKNKLLEQLKRDGLITLVVFSCLDWLPEKLASNKPEEFIGETVRELDLFVPRINKLKQIREKLLQSGVTSKLVIILGDTDLEDYFNLILEQNNIKLDKKLLRQREESYVSSFITRSQERLLSPIEVITWSEIQTLYADTITNIPETMIMQEAEAMKESYLRGRNYTNLEFNIPEQVFFDCAKRKITLYAKQGNAISDFGGGILLQTEMPWLLRTQMLKLSGADVSAIYPWIRQEEINDL